MPVLNRIAAYAEEMKGWRRHLHQYPELSFDLPQTAAFVAERLREIGKRHGRSPGEAAIAWTLHNPAVTGAIVGARNARQADGVMRAAEFQLTNEEVSEIEDSSAQSAA